MDGTVVKAALSGRELARQRRQALAQQGRGALSSLRSAMVRARSAATNGVDLAPAAAPTGCGCGGVNGCQRAAEDGVARMLAAAQATPAVQGGSTASAAHEDKPRVVMATGRALAQARAYSVRRRENAPLAVTLVPSVARELPRRARADSTAPAACRIDG
jgi:hypothetical protein